jgi:pimeloyl-ACP methyl ester carboxylesterase
MGQILGGAIALRFAAVNGSRLKCLVLSNALGLAPFQPAPEFGAALMAFNTEPNGQTHDRLWELCTYDVEKFRVGLGDRWPWLKEYNLDRANVPSLKATQQRLMEQFGFPAIPPDELSKISVPTTLIWGQRDLATPLSVAEAASARYGWPLHIVENAADDPPIEQPQAFLRELRAVLDRVS